MCLILNIITGLGNGGAEGVLYRLCKYDDKSQHIVVSMMDEGKYGPLLKEAGIEVHCLNMPQGRISLTGLWKLFKLLRKIKPDVVQTWMYHADLIGGVVAKFAGVKNIFWNVRHSTLEPGKSKLSTIWVAKACGLVSGWVPKKIVYCAHAAQKVHEAIGYKKGKAVVIGNGYDLSKFSPKDAVKVNHLKSLHKIRSDAFLIGFVGRFTPEKDHQNLINGLGSLKKQGADIQCLLIGRDMDHNNTVLQDWLLSENLLENVLLLGQRQDIPDLLILMDLHVLSSSSEGFPNVLAEAMACGTPCVTTDVGDAVLIVGETGWVAPPKDPQALAYAIMLAMQEKQTNNQAWWLRKEACRERIVETFSIEKMIENYHQTWFGELK